jgi:porphobilinogen deaminase
MAKQALVAVSLAALLGTTQAFAQSPQERPPTTTPGALTMDCKTEMAKAEPMVDSMKDEKQKQETMKEMSMAKEMMAKNDEKGCMTHMQNVDRMLQGGRP